MANNYFSRLHFSIRSNPKTALLSDGAFRLYVILMTLNGDGSIERGVPDFWVASQCGRSLEDVMALKSELVSNDLLVGETWEVKNYTERQYKNFSQSKRDAIRKAEQEKTKKSCKKSCSRPASDLGDVEVEVEIRSRSKKIEEEEEQESNNSCKLPDVVIPKVVTFPQEAVDLAALLGQLMIDNDPKAKLPKTEKQRDTWISAVDKIHRIDGREWGQVEGVIRWCQQDDFWKSNILSATKLRKQFAKLFLAMGRPVTGKFGIAKANELAAQNVIRELENEERNSRTSGNGVDLQRADGGNKDSGLLDWLGGSGRESNTCRIEGVGEGVEVLSEASGDHRDSTEAKKRGDRAEGSS